MKRRKPESLFSNIERFKNERLFKYFTQLLEQLDRQAPLLTAHILEELVTLRSKQSENMIESMVEALEDIVAMSEKEYRYSLAVLYKLLQRTDAFLAEDIIQSFEQDVCKDFSVENVLSVNALDRREVIKRLANIYRGLMRFKLLDRMERKAEVSKASASGSSGKSENSLARDLFNQQEL